MLTCGACRARILVCAVCGDHAGEPALSASCQPCFAARCEDAMIPREVWHQVQHGEFRISTVEAEVDRVTVINHVRRADDGEHLDRMLKGGPS